jgi:SEC-C motif-containing protein
MLCPCGSTALFAHCCKIFILPEKVPFHPKTAEQLMRSRFSAYVTKHGQYIYDTYAQTSKANQSLSDIQQWADESIWLALEVHQSNKDTVEFSAYYIVDNTLCCLTEKSNFVLEQGLWRYQDGEISANTEIAQVKRNELCPCNNYPSAFSAKKGKKYKHCCAK